VVGTMIVNLPGETEDDVIKDLEALDRIKRLSHTFSLPSYPWARSEELPHPADDDTGPVEG